GTRRAEEARGLAPLHGSLSPQGRRVGPAAHRIPGSRPFSTRPCASTSAAGNRRRRSLVAFFPQATLLAPERFRLLALLRLGPVIVLHPLAHPHDELRPCRHAIDLLAAIHPMRG